MPTQNQIDQANYAAMKAREAIASADVGATAGGAPVQSGEEAANANAITAYQRPALGDAAWEMVQPRNLVTTAGEAVGGIPGGFAVQPLATAAQRLSEGQSPVGEGFMGDLAGNAAMNAVGVGAGKVLGKVASAVGQSAPAQTLRGKLATWAMGKVTPDAMDAYRFSGEMIGDAEKAVNALRRNQGKPAYSRSAVEARVARHVEQLKTRGAFTIPELTSGNKVDALEPLASGSLAGKGTFASKQEGKDALMDAWPKIYASLLGEEASGPDELAAIAAMSIEGALRAKQASAGGAMQRVENVVGERVVDITPDLLEPLARQLELYGKRTSPAGGAAKVALDPEGIERPLKAAIALVERSTGMKYDVASGQFAARNAVDMTPYAGYGPDALEAIRASLEADAPVTAVPFTFSNVKTLRGHLREIQSKLPEGEKNEANATLSTFSAALRDKMNAVLDAEDQASGSGLRAAWDSASDEYGRAMALRKGFESQGMIEALQQAGTGKDVLRQVWPDSADINRVGTLKELMGGENSPHWQTLRRYKVEQMLEDKTGDPQGFVNFLTDSKQHSKEYWHEVLGKDQYERVLSFGKTLAFAKRKNPFQGEAGLPRRVEAGYLMRFAGPAGVGALGVINPAAAGAAVASAGAWLVSTKKIAKWLTNPEDSAMFLRIARGKPLRMKEKVWLRGQIGRSIAEAGTADQPDIRPVPATATREGYGAATGRTGALTPATYGGIRG